MMARGVGLAACLALLVASGCVCRGPCGVVRDPLGCCEPDCCNPCLPALKYDRVWRCDPCNECGPGGCGPSGYYHCGLLPTLRAHLGATATCGRGCGEVYWGEWVSDPPDCCDPCNSCGDWQHQQCCSPGLLRRLWWGAHGYRLGGQHGDANCCGGCNSCCGGDVAATGYYDGGSPGCSTCGGGHSHGGEIHHAPHGGGILHENWDQEPIPTSSHPTHQAQPYPVSTRTAGTNATRSAKPMSAPRMTSQPQRQPLPPAATRTTTRPTTAPRSTTQASSPRTPRPWSPVAANQMREEYR
jgi:hypothetical protein